MVVHTNGDMLNNWIVRRKPLMGFGAACSYCQDSRKGSDGVVKLERAGRANRVLAAAHLLVQRHG